MNILSFIRFFRASPCISTENARTFPSVSHKYAHITVVNITMQASAH